MRKLTIIALAVVMVAMGNVAVLATVPEDWDQWILGGVPVSLTAQAPNGHSYGVDGGSLELHYRAAAGGETQRVKQLYYSSGTVSNFGSLIVDELLTTTGSFATLKDNFLIYPLYTSNPVTVSKLTLQVGTEPIGIPVGTVIPGGVIIGASDARAERDFGSTTKADEIQLSANSLTYGGATVTTTTGIGAGNNLWGGAESFGVNVLANGLVSKATVTGSTFNNAGKVDVADVSGGTFYNSGTVTAADFSGGTFNNSGTVTTADFSGGKVNNSGEITSMTYYNGNYNSDNGTIGTLTLAGNSANNTGAWGNVENLQFASDGSGILTITGFSDGTFSNPINAGTVDLNFGNIALDLSGIDAFTGSWEDAFADLYLYNNEISFESLLGVSANSVSGGKGLLSFGVSWGAEKFWILDDDGVFADGWGLSDAGTSVIRTGSTDGGGSSVPEPATLAIIGLGLAGLGLARRRRK